MYIELKRYSNEKDLFSAENKPSRIVIISPLPNRFYDENDCVGMLEYPTDLRSVVLY